MGSTTKTTTATTMAAMKTQGSKKRPGTVFVPQGVAKKRRGQGNTNVSHSSKSQTCSLLPSSCLKTDTGVLSHKKRIQVRKLAPTVNGVAEAARLMGNGQVVVIPTESVYMSCTTIFPRQETTEEALKELRVICDQGEPLLITQRPLQTFERFVSFPQRAYAIQEKNGNASSPAVFSESRQVLARLAKKFWPGPVTIYIATNDASCNLPKQSLGLKNYIGICNPSHPLTNRLLKEASSNDGVVVGMFTSQGGTYMTRAADVCSYFASHSIQENRIVHVLNGEDRRELFAVPTCQYGNPCKYSLWIDESVRTVYIRGIRTDPIVLNEDIVIRGIRRDSPSPINDEKVKNRNRVITAVLGKWNVVDQRTE